MEQKIKAYKAFDKDLSCRGFKYEVGKEYEETGYIKACEKGFHACPYPLDVFGYYAPAGSRFCEVEQSGKIDDSKRSKARSIKNLSKGRGAWHKTGAGMNKKSAVLIKDEKLCGVFPSIQTAGKMIGVAPSLISAICRKVRGKHTANGYRCFFEDSNDWCNLIKQDYE